MNMTTLIRSLAVAVATTLALSAQADETCMSPYIAKIQGQEDYVYVWTLGACAVEVVAPDC